MDGLLEAPLPLCPDAFALTSIVVPDCKSRTKMFPARLVTPLVKSVARLAKATERPSALMIGLREAPLPLVPFVLTLIRALVPFHRSRTNTSALALASLGTRFGATLLKTT